MPVQECAVADKPKAPPRVQKPAKRPRPSRRGSDWNQNFDLKKGPKVWQATRDSNRQRQADRG